MIRLRIDGYVIELVKGDPQYDGNFMGISNSHIIWIRDSTFQSCRKSFTCSCRFIQLICDQSFSFSQFLKCPHILIPTLSLNASRRHPRRYRMAFFSLFMFTLARSIADYHDRTDVTEEDFAQASELRRYGLGDYYWRSLK